MRFKGYLNLLVLDGKLVGFLPLVALKDESNINKN